MKTNPVNMFEEDAVQARLNREEIGMCEMCGNTGIGAFPFGENNYEIDYCQCDIGIERRETESV